MQSSLKYCSRSPKGGILDLTKGDLGCKIKSSLHYLTVAQNSIVINRVYRSSFRNG